MVIGFASIADAEEAGYRPGPSVRQRERQPGNKSSPFNTRRVDSSRRREARTLPNPAITTAPDVVSIPVSQIPPHIRAFIALVDEYGDRIERTQDPRELLRISLELNQLRQDLKDGMVASLWGRQRVAREVPAMMGIMQQLRNAVDYKRRPGAVGFGLTACEHLVNEQKQIVPLIPKVRFDRL